MKKTATSWSSDRSNGPSRSTWGEDARAGVFDQLVKSFSPDEAEDMLTEGPENSQSNCPVALKTGTLEIPGGKGTGGLMSRKGEDARPGPMVRGGAVFGAKAKI